GAQELLIERAEWRAAIAGDVTRRVEAGAAVALLLHEAQPHQRLEAGDEDPAFAQVVFVVERDGFERHRAGLQRQGVRAAPGPTGKVSVAAKDIIVKTPAAMPTG